MRTLIFSILMGIASLCPHCDNEHPILQVGKVESFTGTEAVINIDGELHDWYLEDWYLEKGDKVLIVDCEVVEVLE